MTKAFVTEPLAGIRIYGVIPFESFVQTRTMNPLLPLGYKVWPGRLFTFKKVEEIVLQMRYPASLPRSRSTTSRCAKTSPSTTSSTANR